MGASPYSLGMSFCEAGAEKPSFQWLVEVNEVLSRILQKGGGIAA